MKILALTMRLPYPPHRGDRLRAYRLLERFKAEGHDVTLVSFIEKKQELEHIPALAKICKRIETVHLPYSRSALNMSLGMFSRIPWLVLYYRSGVMTRLIEQLDKNSKFDIAYCHLYRGAGYFARRFEAARTILDLTDAVSSEQTMRSKTLKFPLNFAYKTESVKTEKYEIRAMKRFDETWVVSQREKDKLLALMPNSERSEGMRKIRVVPNPLDLSLFEVKGGSRAADKEKPAVLFLGNMSVPHNIDAVKRYISGIMPAVLGKHPSAEFVVVGADPAPEISKLADTAPAGAVTVTGKVDSLNPYFEKSVLFAAPLDYCAGIQNKVVEAMASGLPVVMTKAVNEGLGCKHGETAFIEDDNAGFSARVSELIGNADLRTKIGSAGREWVKKRFDPESIKLF